MKWEHDSAPAVEGTTRALSPHMIGVDMSIVPQRPLSVAEIDRAYLQLCQVAPRLTEQLSLARAMLLAGAYLTDFDAVRFPHGVDYSVETDCCTCAHPGPSLCVHQVAMRIRRLAVGSALLAEVVS